jgi:hypothetical protein
VTDSTRGGRPLMDEPPSRRLPLRGRLDEPTGTLGSTSGPADGFSDGRGDDWLSSPRPSSAAFAPSSRLSGDQPLNPFASLDPDTPATEPERWRRARTSVPAVFGLLCSVSGAFAALTAVLAPVAFVLGGLGIVLSVLALFTAHKPHVSGRLLAVVGIVLGLGAVALAGVEHVGTVSWLSSNNQPQRLHQWLSARFPFLH